MDYKQLEKEIEDKINLAGKITKETMDNDSVYSAETACDPPYRNKIYGHLFTKEEEMQAEIEQLKTQVDELLEEKRRNNLLQIQRLQADMLFNSIDRLRFLQQCGYTQSFTLFHLE